MKNPRKFFVLCIIALLASSMLFALPLPRKAVKESQPVLPEVSQTVSSEPVVEKKAEPVAPVAEVKKAEPTPVQSEPSLPVSDPEQEKKLNELSALLTDLEKASRMNKTQLTELISSLERIKEDYELVVADAKETEERLTEVENLYRKETRSKFFTTVNGVFGLADEADIKVTYGVGLNLGVRWGKGFMTTVGANYMLGTIGEPFQFELKKKNATATVGLGWEF